MGGRKEEEGGKRKKEVRGRREGKAEGGGGRKEGGKSRKGEVATALPDRLSNRFQQEGQFSILPLANVSEVELFLSGSGAIVDILIVDKLWSGSFLQDRIQNPFLRGHLRQTC